MHKKIVSILPLMAKALSWLFFPLNCIQLCWHITLSSWH